MTLHTCMLRQVRDHERADSQRQPASGGQQLARMPLVCVTMGCRIGWLVGYSVSWLIGYEAPRRLVSWLLRLVVDWLRGATSVG